MRLSSLTSISYDDKGIKLSSIGSKTLIYFFKVDEKSSFFQEELTDLNSSLSSLREQLEKTTSFLVGHPSAFQFSFKGAGLSQIQEKRPIKEIISFESGFPGVVVQTMNVNEYYASL